MTYSPPLLTSPPSSVQRLFLVPKAFVELLLSFGVGFALLVSQVLGCSQGAGAERGHPTSLRSLYKS
jgi:hypothetical protein